MTRYDTNMKRIYALIIALGLSVHPVAAQDGEVQEGFNLMEQGARMLMRGLMAEIEPTLDELRGSLQEMAPVLRDFVTEMGPAMAAVLGEVDDLRNYAAPEVLPNGDIIMRRKPDAPVWVPDAAPDGIEL